MNKLLKLQVIASHGLGNQLFQFAFAHYLNSYFQSKVVFENSPILYKDSLGLDLTYALGDMFKYCPHLKFKKNISISHKSIVGRSIYTYGGGRQIYSFLTKQKKFDIFKESEDNKYKFQSVPTLIKPTSFKGFWQHYKYALFNETCLKNELMQFFTDKFQSSNWIYQNSLDLLTSPNQKNKTLVVHIRRGDFAKRANDKTFGLIKEESYVNLIKKLQKEHNELNVFTFTDDERKLSDFVNLEAFGNVYGPELDPVMILFLMSNANFLISANSSFSWWGAFLSLQNGGEVFIPNKFYRSVNTNDAFLYPNFQIYRNEFI